MQTRPDSQPTLIRFEDVSLRYRQPDAAVDALVLQNLSFAIPAGGFRWLTGPSGAGKTSVLNLITRAARPASGRIHLFGLDAANLNRRETALLRRRIGVVYQDFRLLAHLSVFDNIALPTRIARWPEPRIQADVTDLLGWTGLKEKSACRPAQLSGGEQQRVAFARAVVGQPKLLVADEPTGNLDDAQAERLLLLILALNRLGTTVVVATHNARLIARHPAPVLELAAGRLRPADA